MPNKNPEVHRPEQEWSHGKKSRHPCHCTAICWKMKPSTCRKVQSDSALTKWLPVFDIQAFRVVECLSVEVIYESGKEVGKGTSWRNRISCFATR